MNSVADIWKIVLSRLSQDLSETTISTWFDEVEAVSIKDRTLYLHCPNEFKRSTIESMFSDRIKDSLRDIYSADFDVKLLSPAESTALFEPEVKKSTALLDSGEFTFDTFVVGESNKMAYAAARAVADGVGHYNPLFIYGDSGLGKTHLIYAIAHQIRTTRPSAKIIYIKGDDFINEFIELVRAGRGSEFRAKYRDADLLLVDDVQFVAGKEQVQNEFFHTFNTLYEAGRQIVLTSDRPPSDMHLLDDRLRTFEQRVRDLAKVDGFDVGSCPIEWHTVQDEDWADNWKAYFHTEKVGGLIVIKPAWEDYEASPDDIVIDLDPGAAFGTGTHPTTAMCIRELESAVKGGMRVFDVGTGSGVLAVTAAKLGAGEVIAMDYDRTAARVAQENVERNHVEECVTTGVSDLLQSFTGKADLIIANIIADIVIRLFDELDAHLAEGGHLLASGIIDERVADVTEAALSHGFAIDKVIEESGWAAMVISRGDAQ